MSLIDAQHRVRKNWKDAVLRAVPFGVGSKKPKHFRDMGKILYENLDNAGYAWKILNTGVCDGCALGVAGLHDWTIEGVHLCMTRLNLLRLNTMPELDSACLSDLASLSRLDNEQLRKLGRLPYPMIREKGESGFRRVSWDDAYRRIAGKIRDTDPERLAFFLTSRGITNEVYYVAQKVARFLGTNHIDNAARICHSPSTAAMKRSLGVAATTCSYKDWYGSDLVVFFGANPANDQPVTTKYLHEAKRQGTKVVMVNPYLEPGMKRYWVPSTPSSALFGTDITDYWFPVSQGGDIAFLYGAIKILLERGWYETSFVKDHVRGLDELKSVAAAMDFSVLEKQSGLKKASMEIFAKLIHDARTGVLVWSMGITQHVFGTDGVQMILNLGLLKGWLGRDKCGLMPIRGHSSVQGGAEMGAYSTAFPGGKPITSENAEALEAQYGFPIPGWAGLTAPEMVEAAARGDLDVLYSIGGNFLRNLPDPDYVRDAMAGIPLRVHQDIILTDQMFIPAEEAVVLLPAKTRYEQDGGGVETTTERRVIFSPEIPRQVGEAKAEWKILRELAEAAYPERAHLLGCEDGLRVREEIARVVSFYHGVQDLRRSGDHFQYGGPHLCPGGVCPTDDGKARLYAVELPGTVPSQGLFIVSTRRGKQFNSLIYADIDPLNGAPRDAVLMNPEDAAERHLMHWDRITLLSKAGVYQGRVFFAPIARGNLQIHWPEGNVLVPRGLVDKGGGVPDYNVIVDIKKS